MNVTEEPLPICPSMNVVAAPAPEIVSVWSTDSSPRVKTYVPAGRITVSPAPECVIASRSEPATPSVRVVTVIEFGLVAAGGTTAMRAAMTENVVATIRPRCAHARSR